MGVKKHIKYATVEREKCYILYQESLIVMYAPDKDIEDLNKIPRILGVFSTSEKAREFAEKYLKANSFVTEVETSWINSWTSRAYRNRHGDILTLNLVTKEIDAEYGEISYLPVATL